MGRYTVYAEPNPEKVESASVVHEVTLPEVVDDPEPVGLKKKVKREVKKKAKR